MKPQKQWPLNVNLRTAFQPPSSGCVERNAKGEKHRRNQALGVR